MMTVLTRALAVALISFGSLTVPEASVARARVSQHGYVHVLAGDRPGQDVWHIAGPRNFQVEKLRGGRDEASLVARRRVKLPPNYRLWAHVAVCEESGWYAPGGNYPDAVGIDMANWLQFGGRGHLQHGRLSLRQRIEDARVGNRLIAYYRMPVPDQGQCAAW